MPQSEDGAKPDAPAEGVDSRGDLAHVELEPRDFQDAMEQQAEPPASEKAAPVETADDLISEILRHKTIGRGKPRTWPDTVHYVTRAVSLWMKRGMKRI